MSGAPQFPPEYQPLGVISDLRNAINRLPLNSVSSLALKPQFLLKLLRGVPSLPAKLTAISSGHRRQLAT